METKKRKTGIKFYYRKVILKNIRIILMLLPLVLLFILFTITKVQDLTISRIEREKSGYLESIENMKADMENNIHAVNRIYITEKINKVLTSKEILAYTVSYWDYSLEVNGIPVKEDVITVGPIDSKVEIVLTETRKNNPLPDKVMTIGSLTMGDELDSLENHIVFTGSEYEKVKMNNEGKTQLKYVFDNVKSGQEINFVISFQLGSRVDNIFENIKIIVD